MKRLSNKIAIVTGAASGLGEAIAKGFSREGAKVIITDVNAEGLKNVETDIVNNCGTVLSLEQDVTSEAGWKNVIKSLHKFEYIDIVVNNAGVGIHGNIESTSFEDWKKVLDINLNNVFLGTKYGAEAMIKKGIQGSIINISSIAGLVGDAELLAYSASKGAIRLFNKSAALHLAKSKSGIRVNSIHPGYMNTSLMKLVADPSSYDRSNANWSFG